MRFVLLDIVLVVKSGMHISSDIICKHTLSPHTLVHYSIGHLNGARLVRFLSGAFWEPRSPTLWQRWYRSSRPCDDTFET